MGGRANSRSRKTRKAKRSRVASGIKTGTIRITRKGLAGHKAKKAPTGTAEPGSRLRKQGPEAKLKSYAIKELNESGLKWWRNQSGAIRVRQGARTYMVRMGTPGLSDLMVIGADGKLYCIELKAPKGTVRPEQREFFSACKRAPVIESSPSLEAQLGFNKHIRCFFARSEEDVRNIVNAAKWGLRIDEKDYQK